MARVGRGRSRGGRILDIPTFDPAMRGRGVMIGRGISPLPMPNGQPSTSVNTEENVKEELADQLLKLKKTGEGSFLTITLNYMTSSSDVEYYIDKVMESVLSCSQMVKKFTMSLKLITLLKTHGEQIKISVFKKMQSTFQDMLVLMKDDSSLSAVERESVRNFCELLGQLFFRFRLHLGLPDRYDVLAVPTIECLSYLVRAATCQDLQVLVELLLLNHVALSKVQPEKMMELSFSLRSQLAKSHDLYESFWLLAALDIVNSVDNKVSPQVSSYYAEQLGSVWNETVPPSPVELLAAIPFEVCSHMDKFNVIQNEYNKARLVDL